MICKSCKNEFTDIKGLKFCPYCGMKIEEIINLEFEQITYQFNEVEGGNIVKADSKNKNHHNTLELTAITDEDIKQYNKGKVFSYLRKTFIQKKVVLSIITLLVVIAVGVVGYILFIPKPVDEVRIKEDLIGEVITFPKGTSIEINKDYMKSFSIISRNTDNSLGTDEIIVALALNNGAIEAKTLLSLVYMYKGKNQWKISEKVVLEDVMSLKPVKGMEEKQFLDGLKKLSVTIAGTPQKLGGEDVKKLGINLRTPDLENMKEEILIAASIDSGLLSAAGKIKCKLIFANEAWSISTIEKNSTNDFSLVLSPNFSDKKVIEIIKKEGLEETVTYSNLFGAKGFNVMDRFTKSINISSKKFDAQKRTLSITFKRENTAGEIKTILSTDYTFSMSFSHISLLNKSKTTVDNGTINNLSNVLIISTIDNIEIEGSNILFWWSNNHKITTEEAKTFKADEILSKKGFENIKYVYGSITYIDRGKSKSISFVALYFLVYDESRGYNWKLDKLIGEDSPNYKTYSKEAINQ